MSDIQLEICKEFTFEAAHRLEYHEGKCKNLHGHSYKVSIFYSGPIQDVSADNPESGMVIDFSHISDVWSKFKEQYDHKYLNDYISYPTAENICMTLVLYFKVALKHESAVLSRVRVYETATSYVEWCNR
jgi:6-pyruvoyltetrahydropterin/6-carboxytetrahydropterin synthase